MDNRADAVLPVGLHQARRELAGSKWGARRRGRGSANLLHLLGRLQLLPALDDIELTFRKDYEKGDQEAALVFTGERVKNKFFS